MKFDIQKIKEKIKNIDIQKIKEKIKNIDIQKIKDKIKNIDIQKIKDKTKNINIKNIKKFWNIYKNKIITTILLSLIIIVFWYGISLWLDAKNKYNEVQHNKKEIKKVSDKNIIKTIKENRLRNIYTIANTAYILDNTHTVKEYENSLWKLIILLMYKDKTWNYKNKIDEEIFNNEQNLSEKEKIKFILNIDNQKSSWYSNYKNFIESDSFNSYLSSLIWTPLNLWWNYKNNFNSSILKTLLVSMKELYVYELVFIEDNLEKDSLNYQKIYNSYKYPYEKFLSYIFLPSVNIWKNKFSWKINVDIFWFKYLNKASFIDLNLVKYWSDYFISSYKWKLYQWEKNRIDDISVWKFSLKGSDNVVTLPIKLNFWLNNDKSFYWLINKLTSISDQKNIMIISELTYYLWKNVKNNLSTFMENYEKNLSKNNIKYDKKATIWKKYISALVYKCIYEKWNFYKLNCWQVFGCKNPKSCSQSDFSSDSILSFKKKVLSYNIWQDFYDTFKSALMNNPNYTFSNSLIYKYFFNGYNNINSIDTLLWARLYDCLIKDDYCTDLFIKGNDKFYWIKKTITDFAWCKNLEIDTKCKYDFIDKFDTNYFIAYTMIDKLDNLTNYTYLDRLKDVYKNISWLLQIWQFTFKKGDNAFNTKNDLKYTSTSSLKVYYNYISDKDLNDILNFIWKDKCSYVTKWKTWNIDIAYNYMEWIKNNLYKNDMSASWIYNLNKILSILDWIKKDYKDKTNLEKILANLQAYRILKERGDCHN